MKIIERTILRDITGKSVWYTFDTGHEYRINGFDIESGYTKNGNYTSKSTLLKLARLVGEYEYSKMQIQTNKSKEETPFLYDTN